ncbi:MAG: methyltransferase domain-containing protein [Synergistes sp.]|nr:methyltransferase domain-containing protein [Synergistes sp.]
MADNISDPSIYAKHEQFIEKYSSPILELLAPKAGEKILEIVCDTNTFAEDIAKYGCAVTSTDADKMCTEVGVCADVTDVDTQTTEMAETFDAVVVSCVLHRTPDHYAMVRRVRKLLKEGGRFAVECGGEGCVRIIREGMKIALSKRGIDYKSRNPWKFPEVGTLTGILASNGFQVKSMARFDSPVHLENGLRGWLEDFSKLHTEGFSDAEREAFYKDVEDYCRPMLWSKENGWTADYVRLRFLAVKDTIN